MPMIRCVVEKELDQAEDSLLHAQAVSHDEGRSVTEEVEAFALTFGDWPQDIDGFGCQMLEIERLPSARKFSVGKIPFLRCRPDDYLRELKSRFDDLSVFCAREIFPERQFQRALQGRQRLS